MSFYNKPNITSDAKVCRLCMSQLQLYPIFSNPDETDLLHMIHWCNISLVSKMDRLPKYICNECRTKVHEFYDFKIKCESVEKQLEGLIIEDENKTPCKQRLENGSETADIVTKKMKQLIYMKPESGPSKTAIPTSSLELINFTNTAVENTNELVENAVQGCNYSYQCDKCGKTFRLKASLMKHSFTHKDEKEFSCYFCCKRYNSKNSLAVHLMKHKGIKKYGCDVCSKKFYTSQDLNRHKIIHSDERNYACERCGQRFRRTWDLVAHMRVHTGQRPYACKVCHKTYKSNSGLLKHKSLCGGK